MTPFPMIVGVPRSGTTLLRMMLDAHPELTIPPETGFLLSANICALRDPIAAAQAITKFPPGAPAWSDYGIDSRELTSLVSQRAKSLGDVLRLFYGLYARKIGKPRAGDKTPDHLTVMREIDDVLPEAHFIHIIRDGRDVALSWSQMPYPPTRDIPALVDLWAERVLQARQNAGANYIEVRYSELLREPKCVLTTVCAFVGLSFDDRMLDYHTRAPERLQEHKERLGEDGNVLVDQARRLRQAENTMKPPILSRDGAWRSTMSGADLQLIGAKARALLEEIE